MRPTKQLVDQRAVVLHQFDDHGLIGEGRREGMAAVGAKKDSLPPLCTQLFLCISFLHANEERAAGLVIVHSLGSSGKFG